MGTILLVEQAAPGDSFRCDLAHHVLRSTRGSSTVQVKHVMLDAEGGVSREQVVAMSREMGDLLAVVFAYASDPALIEEVRRETRSTVPVVRLAWRDTRSSIDHCFDQVVGASDLPDWLERLGAGPTRPRELAPALAGSYLAISSPDSPCPWQRDARTSPLFAGLDVDDGVVMQGCSFCIDRLGRRAGRDDTDESPDDPVTRWLSQLRQIRAQAPEAREVVLTDEFPHRGLPAFFEALVGEPGLHGVELLVKSRVDMLLAHAELLDRASTFAAQSGSLLHVYLVGFENFDPWHLQLFNKGHEPADNVRAIELLRSLAARHPQSFEFARKAAHGFVLFTPWTTPEHLLTNAGAMRAVGFGQLRREALRTRVRLHPQRPLYHLAARDGLLADSFPELRGDRAVEQGYDASYPWRFAHPLMETIYTAANALAQEQSSLSEADALEAAVRFVQRHPGLGDAPRPAAVALATASRSAAMRLGPLENRLGPDLLGTDIDLVAILEGLRPACMKEHVPAEYVAPLTDALRRMGLICSPVVTHDSDKATGGRPTGPSEVTLAIASRQDRLDALVAAQRRMLSERTATVVRDLGEILGYPSCCVEAFAKLISQADNLALERAPFLRSPASPLHHLLQRNGPVRLIAHHLCAPDCAASIRYASQLMLALRAIDADGAARIESWLHKPVLLLDYRRRAVLEGEWGAESFSVRHAQGLGGDADFDRAIGDAVAISLHLEAAIVRHADGTTESLRARHPLLMAPGAPMPEAALRALRPLDWPQVLRPGLGLLGFQLARHDAAGDDHLLIFQGKESVTLHVCPFAAEHDGEGIQAGEWWVRVHRVASLSASARSLVGRVLAALARDTAAAQPR